MKKIIYYLPRVLAVLLTLFFGIFILEGFGSDFRIGDLLAHFSLALLLAMATFIAWKYSKIGGWAFIIIGLFFGFFFHPLLWTGLVIGGTTAIIGILFLIC